MRRARFNLPAATAPAALLAAAAVALVACGPDETRTVRPQLVPPQAAQDFGPVPVLNEKRLSIDLLNVGRGPLLISSAKIKEEGGPFRVVGFPERIDAGETHLLELAFLPELEQDYAATLLLESDDPDNPLVELKLVGKGSTRAVMVLEPSALDFGRVAEGQSAVKTFVIESAGTADLIIEELAFVEGSSPAFEFLGSVTTPATVEHQGANGLPGRISVAVRYTVPAGAPDTASATLRVRGTDPEKREQTIAVTGAVNRAPLPVIAQLPTGAPGMELTLDGSASTDPDGDTPLTYKWVLRSKPLGATTTIVGPEQPVTRMTLDALLPGEYVVELQVTDAQGAKNLTPVRASVVAAPAQKLLVELFWDNTQTDIDLHLLRTAQTPINDLPGDCFYQNPEPDWGVTGDDSDDPALVRDALTGYGPEVIGYVNPVEGSTFRVAALFQNANLAQNPASQVTVRIYLYGVVKFEKKYTLAAVGDAWAVADIDWPSGTIRPLQ